MLANDVQYKDVSPFTSDLESSRFVISVGSFWELAHTCRILASSDPEVPPIVGMLLTCRVFLLFILFTSFSIDQNFRALRSLSTASVSTRSTYFITLPILAFLEREVL